MVGVTEQPGYSQGYAQGTLDLCKQLFKALTGQDAQEVADPVQALREKMQQAKQVIDDREKQNALLKVAVLREFGHWSDSLSTDANVRNALHCLNLNGAGWRETRDVCVQFWENRATVARQELGKVRAWYLVSKAKRRALQSELQKAGAQILSLKIKLAQMQIRLEDTKPKLVYAPQATDIKQLQTENQSLYNEAIKLRSENKRAVALMDEVQSLREENEKLKADDLELVRIQRDDYKEAIHEINNGLWGLLYPESANSWEYRTQPLVHIRTELQEREQKIKTLRTALRTALIGYSHFSSIGGMNNTRSGQMAVARWESLWKLTEQPISEPMKLPEPTDDLTECKKALADADLTITRLQERLSEHPQSWLGVTDGAVYEMAWPDLPDGQSYIPYVSPTYSRPAAVAKVEQAQVEQIRQYNEDANLHFERLKRLLLHKDRAINNLIMALYFYADTARWIFTYLGDGGWGRAIIDDRGAKAVAALEAYQVSDAANNDPLVEAMNKADAEVISAAEEWASTPSQEVRNGEFVRPFLPAESRLAGAVMDRRRALRALAEAEKEGSDAQ